MRTLDVRPSKDACNPWTCMGFRERMGTRDTLKSSDAHALVCFYGGQGCARLGAPMPRCAGALMHVPRAMHDLMHAPGSVL